MNDQLITSARAGVTSYSPHPSVLPDVGACPTRLARRQTGLLAAGPERCSTKGNSSQVTYHGSVRLTF